MAKHIPTPSVRMWCVDAHMSDGQHHIQIFDNKDQAQVFVRLMKCATEHRATYNGKQVKSVVLWEM